MSQFPNHSISQSHLEKRLRVFPLRELELEVLALVDQDLSVFSKDDAYALERARRGAFEIDAGRAEPAAMARALELPFRRQVVRRAAQVRACRRERVEPARMLHDVVRGTDDPDAHRFLEALVDANAIFGRQARFELRRRLV